MSGSYRCEPQPSPCQWPGQTLSITQTGTTLDLKNQQGSIAQAKLTSDISLSAGPPWNSLGLILPITRSNGRMGPNGASNSAACTASNGAISLDGSR